MIELGDRGFYERREALMRWQDKQQCGECLAEIIAAVVLLLLFSYDAARAAGVLNGYF